jgi:hypothetical protein
VAVNALTVEFLIVVFVVSVGLASRIFWMAGDSMNWQDSPSFHGPRVSISPLSPSPVESLKT